MTFTEEFLNGKLPFFVQCVLNSIFKFDARFLVLLNNFMREIESTNVFEYSGLNILNYLREKQPTRL